jgi:hypothetical protein
MDEQIINAVIDAGFTPYMRNREDTYMLFTDGTRIGYLQVNRFDGISMSTVHKPNTRTGTGFKIDLPLGARIDKETLEKAFVGAPSWAYASDRAAVQKYLDIDEYVNRDQWNRGFKPITKKEATDA